MNSKELGFSAIFLYTIYSQMSIKFLAGFGIGLYLGTEYDMKPLVSYSKQYLIEKVNDLTQELEKYKKSEEKKSLLSSWFGDSKRP